MKNLLLILTALLIAVPVFAGEELLIAEGQEILFRSGEAIEGTVYHDEKATYSVVWGETPLIDISYELIREHEWVVLYCDYALREGEPNWQSHVETWRLSDEMLLDDPGVGWDEVLPDLKIPFPEGALYIRDVIVLAQFRGDFSVPVKPATVSSTKTQW